MSVGMSLAALSFCLCRLSVTADTADGTGRLILDPTALPVGIRRFAVERDSTGIQTLQRDLLMKPDAVLRVTYTMARPSGPSCRPTSFSLTEIACGPESTRSAHSR